MRVLRVLLLLILFSNTGTAGTLECFLRAEREYKIPAELLISIALVESGLSERKINVNRNGTLDIGIMQVNERNIRRYGYSPAQVAQDPCLQVLLGARYLRECIDKYGLTIYGIGCYHTRKKEEAIRYAIRVLRVLEEVRKVWKR